MSEEILSTVDAEPEVTVEPQLEEVQDIGENATEQVDSEPAEQKPVQTKEENAAFAEMRRAREAAEIKAQQFEKEVQRREDFAKKLGYSSFAELEEAQAQREAEDQRQAYINAGIDPDALDEAISNHPLIKEAQAIANKSKIESGLAELQGKPFFKELEPEIRKTLEVNPGLNSYDVYAYIKGLRSDDLLANAQSMAEKRAIANIHDKKNRGIADGSDGEPEPEIELTAEGKKMAAAFGNDPKEIAKYVKKQIKK